MKADTPCYYCKSAGLSCTESKTLCVYWVVVPNKLLTVIAKLLYIYSYSFDVGTFFIWKINQHESGIIRMICLTIWQFSKDQFEGTHQLSLMQIIIKLSVDRTNRDWTETKNNNKEKKTETKNLVPELPFLMRSWN